MEARLEGGCESIIVWSRDRQSLRTCSPQKVQDVSEESRRRNRSIVATEIRSKIEDLKSKLEKEKQTFAKALTKSSKDETAKFQEAYENFCKGKTAHLQALKDTISRFEEEQERLFVRYEQLRKKEKSLISEQEKFCADKIAQLEQSKKKKLVIKQ
ncbi:putative golgin subfamily A member 6-like protein 3 [Hibiscus syriacus]|uniref:putative golgin subfamily A member 6-like protein 3 n=1 Tax=Hibiscus syriacus TaxID=106335 RepID=UPI0019235C9E|nr:putative golgin subfamily A member 6-like protein 3 [Hibiscus syriacus]